MLPLPLKAPAGSKAGDRSKCSQSQKLAARQASQVVNKLQIESSLKFRSFYPGVAPSYRGTGGEANGVTGTMSVRRAKRSRNSPRADGEHENETRIVQPLSSLAKTPHKQRST